jgi:hypothetical protein
MVILFISIYEIVNESRQQYSAYSISLAPASFNFGAAGNWSCLDAAKSTVNNILSKDVELVLGLGDYMYDHDSARCWFNIVEPIDEIIKISIGNHDAENDNILKEYMNHFGLEEQFYSFRHDNVYFIVMSTESAELLGAEMESPLSDTTLNASYL